MNRNVQDLLAQGVVFLEGVEQQKKDNAKLRDEMRRHNEVAATWTSSMQKLSNDFYKLARQCEKHFDVDSASDGESGSEFSGSEREMVGLERGNRQSIRELKRAAMGAEKRRRSARPRANNTHKKSHARA